MLVEAHSSRRVGMHVRRLTVATLMLSILIVLSGCDTSNDQTSKVKDSSGFIVESVEKQDARQQVPIPVEQKLSQSELDDIYQVLNEYEGCIGSLIPQQVEDACQSLGGSMQPEGEAGCYSCTQQYSDGGQLCTDGSDCQGDCRGWIGFEKMEDDIYTGECAYDDSVFGCYTVIENGKQISGHCID